MPARRLRGGNNNNALGFNPKLIFAQICSMQCYHYCFLGLLLELNRLFYGKSITLDRIFTDQYVKIWSWGGLPDISAIVLASLFGSVLLAIIVEKSKKCLDFSVTLFFIHLVLCTIYSGKLPGTFDWWIVNIFSMIVMTLAGEWLCARKELDEIPLLQL